MLSHVMRTLRDVGLPEDVIRSMPEADAFAMVDEIVKARKRVAKTKVAAPSGQSNDSGKTFVAARRKNKSSPSLF